MKQPTREEITQKIQLVLNEKITRESVYEWAQNYIRNDDIIELEDIDAWHYLIAISNIDEMIAPNNYLFDKEDIQNIMKEYI